MSIGGFGHRTISRSSLLQLCTHQCDESTICGHDPTHSDATSDQGLEDTSKRRADLGALRLLLPENGVLLSLQQRSPRGFGSDSGLPETAHGER